MHSRPLFICVVTCTFLFAIGCRNRNFAESKALADETQGTPVNVEFETHQTANPSPSLYVEVYVFGHEGGTDRRVIKAVEEALGKAFGDGTLTGLKRLPRKDHGETPFCVLFPASNGWSDDLDAAFVMQTKSAFVESVKAATLGIDAQNTTSVRIRDFETFSDDDHCLK